MFPTNRKKTKRNKMKVLKIKFNLNCSFFLNGFAKLNEERIIIKYRRRDFSQRDSFLLILTFSMKKKFDKIKHFISCPLLLLLLKNDINNNHDFPLFIKNGIFVLKIHFYYFSFFVLAIGLQCVNFFLIYTL